MQIGVHCIGLPSQNLFPFPVIHGNAIYGNALFNLKAEKYSENGSAGNFIINAAYNWWGSVDIGAINISIYDYMDNYFSPVVKIQPFFGQELVEVNLLPGINIISLPVAPNEPAASKVFAELQNQGLLVGNLYKWDNLISDWIVYNGNDAVFGDIKIGTAYKVVVSVVQKLHFYGGKITSDFNIGLSLGKNIFGNPFDNDIPVAICGIKNILTGEIKLLQEAVSSGWIEKNIEGWNAAMQNSIILDLSNDLNGLNFNRASGYWVTTKIANLELVIPPKISDILDITITPNPFSPDEDFIEDSTTVTVVLSNPGLTRVYIYDINNNLIRELLLNQKQNPINTYEVIWDGRNSSGSYVKNGSYTAYIDVGSKLRRIQRIIQVNKYPIISNYIAIPSPFSPDNDGKDDISAISFSLSEDAKIIWGAQIYEDLGPVLRVMLIVTGVKSNQIYGGEVTPSRKRKDEIESELGIEFMD